MPAMNMGGTVASNPSTGKPVIMDPFSGPKGSPLDNDQTGNHSTGALNTGIGFGSGVVISAPADPNIKNAGYTDDYTPGVTKPGGGSASDSTLTTIGGGRSLATEGGETVNAPFNAQPLLGFGNGGNRDAGAGPEHTGFGQKMVTASGTVANGAVIETGFTNRSGQSSFGVNGTASAAVNYRGSVTATLTIDDGAGEADVEGDTVYVDDGTEVTVQFLQDGVVVLEDSGVVGSDAYAFEGIDISGLDAGSVEVIVTTKDKWNYLITAEDDGTYTPPGG